MCTSHAVPWLKSSFAAFWHFSNGNERRKSTRKKRKIQFFFFILREKKYETLKKMIQPADCWSKSLTWKRRGAFIVMCPRWVLDMVRPWILTLSISKPYMYNTPYNALKGVFQKPANYKTQKGLSGNISHTKQNLQFKTRLSDRLNIVWISGIPKIRTFWISDTIMLRYLQLDVTWLRRPFEKILVENVRKSFIGLDFRCHWNSRPFDNQAFEGRVFCPIGLLNYNFLFFLLALKLTRT